MSNAAPLLAPDLRAQPFPSLEALLDAHDTLLLQRQHSSSAASFRDAAIAFTHAAQATGVRFLVEADRRTAQGVIDYWANTLYRGGHDMPDVVLADFDPAFARKLRDEDCPYVGLNAFQPEQSALFYGRERLVNSLLALVDQRRLVLVVGPSGSGKSSLVLGGLVPQLQQGALSQSAHWRYLPRVVPGSKPLENLARVFCPPDKDLKWWTERMTKGLRKQSDCLAPW